VSSVEAIAKTKPATALLLSVKEEEEGALWIPAARTTERIAKKRELPMMTVGIKVYVIS
jgi:hypothetical protein